jgi:catechol 2,3-dioxygenase-like lactoylglutathione lyase family enzyme
MGPHHFSAPSVRSLLHRREFLASSTGLFLALHAEGLASPFTRAGASQQKQKGKTPRIRAIRMQTHVLPAVRDFYAQKFGFKVIAESAERVALQAGGTRLEFEQVRDGSQPFYHFAFNIPENKLELARPWLAERVPILRHARNGNEVIHFEQWNAHSLFFNDPAGNLGELIARHTLPNAAPGAFTATDILYASEIGMTPPDQAGFFADVRQRLQISPYLDSSSFLGDEYGILIVIPKEVRWIPEFKKSGELFPTSVTVAGHGARHLRFDPLPFEIVSTKA